MLLTILGCSGPYPAQGGACSGYLLESNSGKTRLLIDCGSGVLSRLPDPASLSGAVLTHLHYDHMSDMLPLQYYLQFHPRTRPLPVIAPLEPREIRNLLDCAYYDLESQEDRELGEMTLRFLPAKHPVPGACVCVECDQSKFVFTGDTNELPELSLFADRADLLLMDAGLSEADWSAGKPHLSAMRCAKIAREAHARALILTHLNPQYDPAALLQEAQAEYPGAQLAVPGRKIPV